MLSFDRLFSVVTTLGVQVLRPLFGLSLPTLSVDVAPQAPGFVGAAVALVDGAAVAINAALGETFTLTCANNNARVFGVPTNGVVGQRLFVRIINTSGGALTVTTFNAGIKQPALTLPATGTNRGYELYFDGTNWSIVNFSPANVPN